MIIVSVPSFINRKSGSRLIRNASFTAVLTWERAQCGCLGWGFMVVSVGYARSVKIVIKLVDIIIGVKYIATTWSCTKSSWFLRPVDNYYPLEACE